MSLEDIRCECTDAAKLLQPYIDGELSKEEHERVARHLESCNGCRSAVREQHWVRTILQSLERERAPQALRARILLGLDEIDAERTEAMTRGSVEQGLGRRVLRKMRDLARGGMIMIPAGAVAVALFVAARQGLLPGDVDTKAATPGSLVDQDGKKDDEAVLRALEELQPKLDFPVQVAGQQGAAQLVGAGIDANVPHPLGGPGARLEYDVPLPGGVATRVIDRQAQPSGIAPRGDRKVFRGRTYYLDRDAEGRPVVYVQVGGVAHVLTVRGGHYLHGATNRPSAADFAVLLNLAHGLRQPAAAQ
jgi:mycothiol system anti-sigma-R factor